MSQIESFPAADGVKASAKAGRTSSLLEFCAIVLLAALAAYAAAA